MKVLVVGGGGREHALAWKLARSPSVSAVYCAPGNAGIAEIAEVVEIAPDDVPGLVRFVEEAAIDLTVVGPELPLKLGLVDALESRGLAAFGPRKAGARLEASKAFAKQLMRRHRIPTGYFSVFGDPDEAQRYVREVGAPIVVKADGLAAGKGVFVCRTTAEAEEAVDEIMRGRIFGDAGERVVVEEYLEGEEVSFMIVTDGRRVLPLASSQDHKRAFEGDTGPNTGGMGACSPAPPLAPELEARVMDEIMRPVVRALAEEGIGYRGVIYAGLMLTAAGPKVLEFNVRFGDPECQVLMVRLRSDLAPVLAGAAQGRLPDAALEWDARAAVCVVLVADGYPGVYQKGAVIEGLERLREWPNGVVFHAGTARHDGRVVTSGGRVLGVTALGATVAEAAEEAYRAVEVLHWPGMRYRRDIARKWREGPA